MVTVIGGVNSESVIVEHVGLAYTNAMTHIHYRGLRKN